MHRGYVKLYRKVLEGGIIKNPAAWQLMCYCLLKATHRKRDEIVGSQVVKLEPGQFVFGRLKTAATLNLSESAVRRAMNLLKKCNVVTIKATNKFSVVSIVKWHLYQSDDPTDEPTDEPTNDQQTTNKRPTDDQQATTNKNNKHIKNEKNKEVIKPKRLTREKRLEELASIIGQYQISDRLKKALYDWAEHKEEIKNKLTPRALKMIYNRIDKDFKSDEHMIDCIEISIMNGWKSIVDKNKDRKQAGRQNKKTASQIIQEGLASGRYE